MREDILAKGWVATAQEAVAADYAEFGSDSYDYFKAIYFAEGGSATAMADIYDFKLTYGYAAMTNTAGQAYNSQYKCPGSYEQANALRDEYGDFSCSFLYCCEQGTLEIYKNVTIDPSSYVAT